jgi:hypothetical protein
MAKRYEIRTTRDIQIDGFDDVVPGDSVVATIETDCNIGSLISCLQFGNARMVDTEAEASAPAGDPTAEPKTKRTRKSA